MSKSGAGRQHSHAASASWPMKIFCIIGVMLSLWMGVGWGIGILFFPGSSNFYASLVFFGEFCEIHGSWSLLRDWLCTWSSGSEKNCIVYSLLWIFIIIIITTIISISFVLILNCLYLNLRVYFLSISPPHPTGGKGRGERAAVWP